MKINVGMVTTWDIKCGIATYSKYLIDKLKEQQSINISIIKNNKKTNNLFYWFSLGFRNRKHDIIHIQHEHGLFGFHGWGYFPFYAGLKINTSNKIIVTIHETSKLKDGFIYKRLLPLFCNKIITHVKSDEYKNAIIIPHGTQEFTQLPHSLLNTILCPGFINENKGVDRIIKILPQIPNAQLIIAGTIRTEQDLPYLNRLKEQINILKLNDRVKFTGFIEDFKSCFSSANVVVFPYHSTTQSGMLAIALSYGANIITSNTTTFNTLKNKYNCIETADTDEDFINKIKCAFLMGNTHMKEIKNYCDLTSWKSIAKQHINLYRILT